MVGMYLDQILPAFNETDDYMVRLSMDRSNATLLRPYLSMLAGIIPNEALLAFRNCLDEEDLKIENIQTDLALNVTKNRSDAQKEEIKNTREKIAKYREALLQWTEGDFPEQCQGDAYIRPSDDYIELMMKCDDATVPNVLYPSPTATCPEECIQFATLAEQELPGCELVESLLMSMEGSYLTRMYAFNGTLPSGDDQKLLMSVLSASTSTSYPENFFDQDNRRETYATNATMATGFLQVVAKDMISDFSTTMHLGCLRKNPKGPTLADYGAFLDETSSSSDATTISVALLLCSYLVIMTLSFCG